jgi:hypothetical protein
VHLVGFTNRAVSVVWLLPHVKTFLSGRNFGSYLGLKMCFRAYFVTVHQNYMCCVYGRVFPCLAVQLSNFAYTATC